MSPAYEHVLVEATDSIATVTLNRPERLNAFLETTPTEIADAVERLAADPGVRVIVITGAGRAFSAGADVEVLRSLIDRGDTPGMKALVSGGRRVLRAIRLASKPVIAAVNGPAAGGGANLALACDLRIASDRAAIGQTFGRIGLHPDWGGTYFLPRLVGSGKAAELFFTATMLDAAEAHRIGIFQRVVPHDRLSDEVRTLARALAGMPPRPLALVKEALRRTWRASLDEMLDHELRAQLECAMTDDAREGVRAFLEKREPRYGGA